MVAKSPEFEKAIGESRKLKAKPNNDELLELYAHFKQGSADPKFEDSPKPGMLDLTGKAKYRAWEGVSTMDPEEAQKKYVEIVERLKGKYGFEG